MRHLVSIAALAILPLTVVAQPANEPGPKSAKTLPTTPMFRGGFARPIFQSGFAQALYPQGLGPSIAPRAAQAVTPAPQPKPQVVEQPTPTSTPAPAPTPAEAIALPHPGSDDPDHDGCTGACAHDHGEHGHDADQPGAVGSQEASLSARDRLLAKLRPIDEDAFKRSNRPEAGAAPACVKCHSDRNNFVKKQNDFRLLRQPDTHMINAVDHSTPSSHPPARQPELQSDPQEPLASMISAAPAAAADSFRDHLKAQPDDFSAMRLYALALLSSKHPTDAADTMAKAYESDPLLAKEPIDLKAAGLDGPRVAALIKTAEDAAHQSKTSAAWLLSAVLQQARGSQAQALAALDNSRRLGLNADVADWLAAQLKKSPERAVQAASK